MSMAYCFGKVRGRSDVDPSCMACHRPDGFLPVHLLLGGWEGVLVAEEGPVDRLGLSDDAPFVFVMWLVGKRDILCISGSIRSRLYGPVSQSQ